MYTRIGRMAKIIEDVMVVKLSKIVRESSTESVILATRDLQQSLEQVVQELVGEGIIVEVVAAE